MWQPREDYWNYIRGLLESSVGTGVTTSTITKTDHSAISKAIEEFSKLPDSAYYFAFIFVFDEESSEPARGLSGLLLKNKLRASVDCLEEEKVLELLKIIKIPLLNLLNNSRQFSFLQRTVGTILSTLVKDCNGLEIWPSLLSDLLGNFKNNEKAVLTCLEKICEDAAFELIEFPEIFENILTILKDSKDENILKILFSIISHLIPTQISILTENVNFLLMCVLSNWESLELKISSCRLLSTLLEFYWNFLSVENVKTIFNYVLILTLGDDKDLLKECGEFWLLQVQSDSVIEQFRMAPEILENLIPILMNRCVYDDEEDEDELCNAMEDLSVPDDEEDLKPRHRKGKEKAGFDDNDDNDDDNDDDSVVSSLRKCSAATLDGLSLAVDPSLVLSIFLPHFNTLVAASNWKTREGALLALGAVAEGLWQHLAEHFDQIVPFLLANAREHPHPLVRSMSLWTLSRTSSWLTTWDSCDFDGSAARIDSQGHRPTLLLLDEALTILIGSLGDANKRVQQSAATGLCKFLESSNSPQFLSLNHRKSLISAIFLALKCYQRKSLLILFDLIRVFTQIGDDLLEFDQESFLYWRQIAVDLVDRLNPQSIADSSIFPVIEALMSILLLDFNGKLLEQPKRDEMEFKALTLAAQNLTALKEQEQEEIFIETISSEGLDDFLIAALDLLAAATESSKLTPSPHLHQLLKNILSASLSFKESTNVRQSAFALFGDYAVNNPSILFALESSYFSALNVNLYPTSLTDCRNPPVIVSMATATNAIWSLGEFSLHTEIPVDLLNHLIAILKDKTVLEVGARIYFENLAVCIGRIFIKTSANIEISSSFLNRILNLLTTVESDSERSTAFTGLICNFKRFGNLNERDYQIFIKKLNDSINFSSPSADLSQILIGFKHPQVDSSFYSTLQPGLGQLLG